MARDNTIELLIKARDRATRQVKGVARSVEVLKTRADAARNAFFSLQTAIAGIGAGLAARSIYKAGEGFEQTMTEVLGIARATRDEFEALEAQARKMGETTEWSASQAGQALKFMSMAGMTAEQSVKALPGVLDLATAGQIDLARASDIATNALSAMRLPVEELSRVNDTFVQTTTSSNTNIEMMAESFKYAAPVAAGFGYDVAELSALIGILGNNGIQASQAGTQLKGAFQDASKVFDYYEVSAKKANGETKDLVDALELLEERGAEANEIMSLFGERAGVAINALFGTGSQAVRQYIEYIRQAEGASTDLAATFRSTARNAKKELFSVIESTAIDVFDKYKVRLKAAIQATTATIRENKEQVVSFITGLIDGLGAAIQTLAGQTATVVDTLQKPLSDIWDALNEMWDGFRSLPTWVQEIGIVAAFLGGKKGKILVGGAAFLAGEIKDAYQGIQYWTEGRISWREASDEDTFEKALERERAKDREELKAMDKGDGEEAGEENAEGFFAGWQRRFREQQDKLKKQLAKIFETNENAPDKGSGGPKPDDTGTTSEEVTAKLTEAVKLQSALSRALAKSQTSLAALDAQYERHAINVEDYFERKRELELEAIDTEIKSLRETAEAEARRLREQAAVTSDAKEREQLLIQAKKTMLKAEDEIVQKLEERKQKVIELGLAEEEAREKREQDRRNRESLLTDISARGAGENDLQAQQDAELERLRNKHAQELQQLKDYGASKQEILEAQAAQEMALERRKGEMQREMFDKRLSWASKFTGDLANTMKGLYESGVLRNKQALQAYKALAITQTIIDTYRAAQEAYASMASIPYVGPALGAAAAGSAIAAGMARVAAIKSQSLEGYAYGGEIQGPRQGDRSDNVTIRATPGEYMMDRPTVRHYGLDVMEALRQRAIPREIFSGLALPSSRPAYAKAGFAYGGQVGAGAGTTAGRDAGDVTIVNIMDRSELDRYMASSSGQNAVLNVMSSQKRRVQRILQG